MRGTRLSRPPGVCASAAMILVLTACARTPAGDTLDQVRRSGVLRVALTEANPPWNFLDREGRLKGYDVDVAREVARRINAPRVRFIGTDFATFIGGIRAGKYDIVISGQTVTAERREQVAFSRPYALNGVAVFVHAGDPAIHGPADLPGKKIGVSEGTVQADYARTRIRRAKVKTYRNAVLALNDLSWGRCDAVLVSRFQGDYLAEHRRLAIAPVGRILHEYPLSMSFRKGAPAFEAAVDTAINAMIGDGTLSAISRRRLNGRDMAAELDAARSDATTG
ncbi:transporter substrate-binding domain-containing protein [Actinoallomurus iriomotensis]|uniref:ABC transporter substrate-binding protein n=1 Tax=Actinoallomurus iriomotensis TaxID=478107 RepID=A0A9W6S796_9ACTN|nr:transporter substrate-binding domain-containing protein [Actinoallomurus iriomotensis]GLY88364.1 ABC transporter substrate-binding protein [Actinoallomurus iriomotensis]